MKPGLVGRYLTEHPEAVDESLLIIDPDCLPLRPWPDAIPGVLLGGWAARGAAPRPLRWGVTTLVFLSGITTLTRALAP